MADDWVSNEERSAGPTYPSRHRGRGRIFINSSRGFRGGARGGSRGSSNWRDRDDDSPANSNPQNRFVTEGKSIQVQSSLVGRIIGRGGSKIRELQSESGCRIKINNSNGDNEATVILDGSAEEQEKAENLIKDLIEDSQNKPFRSDNDFSHSNSRNSGTYGGESGGSAFVSESEENKQIDWVNLYKAHDEYQKEKWAKLPPLKKDFYNEDPEVAAMPQKEVDHWRKVNNNITIKRTFDDKPGLRKIPNPVQTFEQCFSAYPEILNEIYKQSFTAPSPIQSQAWPVLLRGEDLIGIAQTGTGKTLAFLLPALIHIDNQPIPRSERKGPNVLVLAPTRELALQIEKEVGKYSYRDIKAVCVYGGGSRKEQIQTVSRGVEIVIATPGRLNDLVMARVLDVNTFTYLVLDEADRMLDMGFEPQIRKSLLDIRPDRQTIMTSATWPPGVRRLAETYMKDPIQVFVGSLDLAAVHTVTQEILFVEEDDKLPTLMEFFQNMASDDKVIVFCGRKTTADYISCELTLLGITCQSIHGDREQSDREQALEDIKNGDVNILIATDVASRGIDINDITHVINFDFPRDMEEYVHRVGRTGRAGKTGKAISFLARNNWSNAGKLIEILEEAHQDVPDELRNMCERFEAMKLRRGDDYNRRGRGGRGSRYGGGNRW